LVPKLHLKAHHGQEHVEARQHDDHAHKPLEVKEVARTDAFPHPGAVMIPPRYTHPTVRAVLGATRLEHRTFGAAPTNPAAGSRPGGGELADSLLFKQGTKR
jgi:hypothetical protein